MRGWKRAAARAALCKTMPPSAFASLLSPAPLRHNATALLHYNQDTTTNSNKRSHVGAVQQHERARLDLDRVKRAEIIARRRPVKLERARRGVAHEAARDAGGVRALEAPEAAVGAVCVRWWCGL